MSNIHFARREGAFAEGRGQVDAADLITTALSKVGDYFSESPRSPSDLCGHDGRHVCGYLKGPRVVEACSVMKS